MEATQTETIEPAEAQELSWFAIRQPTVVRFLERRLWAPDGDAFALALDAVCRLHAAMSVADGVEPPRVSEALLRQGLDMTPPPSLETWIGDLCLAAPVVLSPAEEACVTRVVSAVAWGFAAARAADVGDAIVR
ncbi:MAG TPA: hypothetical protein VM734_34745 [Kofleriaceae bacterium]|nr:hypothetical protein [Kofleriaceae bacterium]